MQYKLLAISALAAVVVAAPEEKRQGPPSHASFSTPSDLVSILSVLETAIPSSILAVASTNPAEASSEISAEFASGSTPSWFSALPTGVKTFLLGDGTTTATSSATSSDVTSSAATSSYKSAVSTGVAPHSVASTGGLTSSHSTSTAATHSTSGQSGSAGATGASTSSTKNAAALPTAAVGMGMVGAMGLVGLFAL